MVLEVACGQCQGRLLIEHTGVVVECPHCGAHLTIEDDSAPAEAPPSPQPAEPISEVSFLESATFDEPVQPGPAASLQLRGMEPIPDFRAPEPVVEQAALAETIMGTVGTAPWSQVAPAEPMPAFLAGLDSQLVFEPATPATTAPVEIAQQPVMSAATLEETSPAVSVVSEPATAESAPLFGESPPFDPLSWNTEQTVTTPAPPSLTVTAPAAAFTPTPVSAPTNAKAAPAPTPTAGGLAGFSGFASIASHPKGVSPVLFMFAVSYASALTLALLYLFASGKIGGGSTLDLPDLKPVINKKNGKIAFRLVTAETLPGNHLLKLGESRQYGSVKVTALKVTRGPLDFVHYNNPSRSRPSTQPVLKLWLRFENVSRNQEFSPLDKELLFSRVPDKKKLGYRANNFVCRAAEKGKPDRRVLVYDLPIEGDWDLKRQDLDKVLDPKESWETYIPTNDDDLSHLTGDLVWRVHFRKGYNPSSERGVTTLIEIPFKSSQIKDEA